MIVPGAAETVKWLRPKLSPKGSLWELREESVGLYGERLDQKPLRICSWGAGQGAGILWVLESSLSA